MNNEPQVFTGIRMMLVLTQGDIKVSWMDSGKAGVAIVCVRTIKPKGFWNWLLNVEKTEIFGSILTFSDIYEVNNLSPTANANHLRKALKEALREEKQWKELHSES